MKYSRNRKPYSTRSGRLWRIAEHLEDTAQAVRYANKPYDLVFPITRLTDLVNQTRDLKYWWLADKLGLDKRNFGRWPKL